jgi:hypothetical protein
MRTAQATLQDSACPQPDSFIHRQVLTGLTAGRGATSQRSAGGVLSALSITWAPPAWACSARQSCERPPSPPLLPASLTLPTSCLSPSSRTSGLRADRTADWRAASSLKTPWKKEGSRPQAGSQDQSCWLRHAPPSQVASSTRAPRRGEQGA